MLHIDIHGKGDSKDKQEIEMGMMPLYQYSSDQEYSNYVTPLQNYFVQQTKELFKSDKVGVDPDCRLHGFWGGSGDNKLHTMTEQGVMFGITSFQLEIPRTFRRKLAHSPKYIAGLAKIIVDLYNDYVVPRWMCKEICVQ